MIIASGKTRTYGFISDEVNTGARVVGTACSSNKIPLIIPCHRVINKDSSKKLQYASGGDLKEWLLNFEKN
jgi:methylated-DNA-[protein]-cysteine S-methyltransferase